jgi:hypothetical protein
MDDKHKFRTSDVNSKLTGYLSYVKIKQKIYKSSIKYYQIKLTIFNIYSDGTAYVRIKIPACEGEIHLAHTFMYELCLHCRLHSECKMKNNNKNTFFGITLEKLF